MKDGEPESGSVVDVEVVDVVVVTVVWVGAEGQGLPGIINKLLQP